MEEIKDLNQTAEREYRLSYQKIFKHENLQKQLLFVHHWLMMFLGNPSIEKAITNSNLLFNYQNLIELGEITHQLQHKISLVPGELEVLIIVPPYLAKLESKHHNQHFQSLSAEEVLNPITCLSFLSTYADLDDYKKTLFLWLSGSLENGYNANTIDQVLPLFAKVKKLIETSWLINYRLNKGQKRMTKQISNFADTCPTMLENEDIFDPYAQIIEFYNGACLNSYRQDLRDWFKACMTDGVKVRKDSEVIFFHAQLMRLIHSGYLIVSCEVPYLINKPYCEGCATFGDWIQGVKASRMDVDFDAARQYELLVLSEDEIEDPIKALATILTLSSIKNIRFGLTEWLYFGFVKGDFLGATDAEYGFELFEKLEKLLELTFLMVVPQAGKPQQIEKEESEND